MIFSDYNLSVNLSILIIVLESLVLQKESISQYLTEIPHVIPHIGITLYLIPHRSTSFPFQDIDRL